MYVVRRPTGLPAGCTMTEVAALHADALGSEFGGPVDLQGISTGGSVALQLALDHPRVVNRLVLLAGACRLSPGGRRLQRRYAELLAAGDYRRAAAVTAPAVTTSPVGRRLVAGALWLAGPHLLPDGPGDLLRIIEAEDAFDVSDRLPHLAAPLLVVGGERDPYYPAELFRQTAASAPHGRLVLLPGKGHGSTVVSRSATTETVRFLTAATESPGRTT